MTRVTSNLLIVVIVGVLACVTSMRAEVSRYASYTIPGLSNPIQQIDLADVDGDGSAEVLASDGFNLILYSVTGDSVIFADTMEYSTWSLYYKVLLADIDRDSVIDIVVGRVVDWEGAHTGIVCYKGGTNYTRVDDTVDGGAYYAGLGVGRILLDVADVDRDGIDELVFSFESQENIYWNFDYQTVGKTIIYYSFPDSIMAELPVHLDGLFALSEETETSDIFSHRVSERYEEFPGISHNEVSQSIVKLDSTGSPTELLNWPASYCSDHLRTIRVSTATHGCHVGTTASSTAVGSYYDYVACTEGSGPDLVETHTGHFGYRVVESGAAEIVWVSESDIALQNFHFDPSWPSAFFAFHGDTLMRLSAVDGSMEKRYDPLPAGTKAWVYPYGDGVPYLMVVSDQTVTYYTFDEVTDVETGTPSVLPTTFTLGQPYPNPFNPIVTIPLAVDRRGLLRVDVFNPLGQRVAALHDAVVSPGETVLSWDASDFGSGVYLIKATLGEITQSVKAVLVK